MNDRHDGYAGDQYELIGYDANGQPVYRQVPPQRPPHQQDGPSGGPHGAHHGQGHGPYDGYGTAPQYGAPQEPYGYDDTPQPPDGRDWYAQAGQQPAVSPYDPPPQPDGSGWYPQTGQQPVVPHQDPYGTGPQAAVPHQQAPGTYETAQQPVVPAQQPYEPHDPAGRGADTADTGAHPRAPREPGPDQGPGGTPEPGYRPDQFAFVEDDPEDSEDVIDWLKFTESRTERREEARRRARARVIALVVVLALALVGGVGYLWYAGKLPDLSSESKKAGTTTAVGAQNRDVIVVHLHNTKQGGTSTMLLVDNTTTKHGATLLLPNSLALTADDGTATTLGKSVRDDGSTGTRESMDTLLGTQIQGTWRLDTPYLENLVELVGGIEVTTDTDVPDPNAKGSKDGKGGKGDEGTPEPLVKKGEKQSLSGAMAVAYATYRGPGEPETAQLDRFGQVMQGVLRKMSSDPASATTTVQTLQQILDPSLTDKDLGAFLAKLADLAKGGDYTTTLLPVQQDGTLDERATSRVKEVLGGTVKPAEEGAAVRVGVKNATGAKEATDSARVTLVNGGYTFVDGSTAPAQATSLITYADDKRKQDAVEVAKTLGLPTSAVKKGKTSNADVSVVLGQDYDYRRKTS